MTKAVMRVYSEIWLVTVFQQAVGFIYSRQLQLTGGLQVPAASTMACALYCLLCTK